MTLAILQSGMITAVGYSAPASCAAIRAKINRYRETRFMVGGEWVLGCEVPLTAHLGGRAKLRALVEHASRECLAPLSHVRSTEILLLVVVAERSRPGRVDGIEGEVIGWIEAAMGTRFHSHSEVFSEGRVGGVSALARGAAWLREGVKYCVVVGVDSYLRRETIADFAARRVIRTAENADGFVPGEAATAVLLGRHGGEDSLTLAGFGFGQDPSTAENDEPVRGDGLTEALRAAFQSSGTGWDRVDYRIADISGGQRGFREASLALTRTLRTRRDVVKVWHPAECIGDIGAATVPCLLSVALAASRRRYAPGPGVLIHVSGEDGRRAAVICTAGGGH